MDYKDTIRQQIADIEQRIQEASSLLHDPEMKLLAEEDIANLEKQKQALELSLDPTAFNDTDEPDTDESQDVKANEAILEIRPAAGGAEAGLFANELLRMYERFAQEKQWNFQVIDLRHTSANELKIAVVKIKGKECFALLKNESGVHRVQRVPETESSGRIHTSTVTVAVLPILKERTLNISPADLKFDTFRSSGPGGQNVNKVETAVRVTHVPTGLVVESQESRSQQQNRERALQLLTSRLYNMMQEQQRETLDGLRADQVGTGERSEKIRTYNFPQNRVTDHRIGESWHNIGGIMNGDIEKMLKALGEKLESVG